MIADHIDGDGTNNRRRNLLNVTLAENSKNRRRANHNRSGYKGVYRRERSFEVKITSDGRRYRKAGFATARQAAIHYNEMARKLHKQFARLNDV
jgi:hypothetical protein